MELSVLTSAQKEQFAKDGFVIVPDVLTKQQVAEMRATLRKIFEAPSKLDGDSDPPWDGVSWERGQIGTIRSDVCARHPELRWLLAHEPIVSALRSLLGDDFLYLPEMSAHWRGFGEWHKDTTSQERAGKRFHWDADYLMVEAALYMQDNDPRYGGGLDVIPGSHEQPDTYVGHTSTDVLNKAKNKLKQWGVIPPKKGYSIPSKAGDLVLFHYRIDHRASWPSVQTKPPVDKEKMAVFFGCSRNNAHAKTYLDHLLARPDYTFLRGHKYPDELLALAREKKLSLYDG